MPGPPPAGEDAQAQSLEYTIDTSDKQKLGKAIVENYLWTLERNEGVYVWQDYSTRNTFYVVIFLVMVGVVFSGIQFFKGRTVKGAAGDTEQVSNLEFSAKGVKVSSPFLGVIILVISLAFFYLYLAHVYPISLTK